MSEFDGSGAGAAASWSDTSITVNVPTGVPAGRAALTVAVAGLVDRSVSYVVMPGVTSVSASSGAAGTQVTIAGQTFGATQGAGRGPRRGRSR